MAEKSIESEKSFLAGYHVKPIPKGQLGYSSKLMEEVLELQDAESQACKIMTLVELSDLLGAMSAYLRTNFPGMTIRDLEIMSQITERAFANGHRKATPD